MKIDFVTLSSPIGPLAFAVNEETLVRLDLGGDISRLRHDLERRFGAVELRARRYPGGVGSLLSRYFRGELEALDEVLVDPGGTIFQREIWLRLREIPAGYTWSYAALARAVGRPAAVRAVGAANAANPIPLVLPCHRVIGTDGRLTGYGGGLNRKQWLLRHERARLVPHSLPLFGAPDR